MRFHEKEEGLDEKIIIAMAAIVFVTLVGTLLITNHVNEKLFLL